LTAKEDPALTELGEALIRLVQSRNVTNFEAELIPSFDSVLFVGP
jgi:hypothetical protein